MRKLTLGAALAVALAGCTPAPATQTAAIKEKVYVVTPNAVKVKLGVLSGEITDMKVVERVEEGSGRVDTPARLTGKLVLTNVSADQTLRMLGGNVVYVDMQGKPIPLEGNRTGPTLKAPGAYSQERLDPGQESTQAVEAEFPVDALKAKRLKEIRLDLQYIPSAFRQEAMRFGVAISELDSKQ